MRKPMRLIAACLSTVFLFAMVSACNTGRYAKMMNDQNREAVQKRASFDLSCPAKGLKLAPIDGKEIAAQYGVTGCGKKAVYVNASISSAASQAKWILNASTQGGAAPK